MWHGKDVLSHLFLLYVYASSALVKRGQKEHVYLFLHVQQPDLDRWPIDLVSITSANTGTMDEANLERIVAMEG